jgi:hypothetical protein
MVDPIEPTTQRLCGDFTEPENPDVGRDYSAPIVLSCEAPAETVDGEAEVVFVDDEPQFEESP